MGILNITARKTIKISIVKEVFLIILGTLKFASLKGYVLGYSEIIMNKVEMQEISHTIEKNQQVEADENFCEEPVIFRYCPDTKT